MKIYIKQINSETNSCTKVHKFDKYETSQIIMKFVLFVFKLLCHVNWFLKISKYVTKLRYLPPALHSFKNQ